MSRSAWSEADRQFVAACEREALVWNGAVLLILLVVGVIVWGLL